MCTLTLLPRPGGYRLAMTRDERRSRGRGLPPRLDAIGGRRFLAPRDVDAGGSWIALDELGRTLCLLNGDRVAQGWREPVDAGSRGTLLVEMVPLPDAAAIERELANRLRAGALRVRPFQLVLIEPNGRAARMIFDGATLAREGTALPSIHTSNGFDPVGVARSRGVRFQEWLRTGGEAPDGETLARLVELHRSHVGRPNEGVPASFCLHRAEVASVSLTLVEVGEDGVKMVHQPGQPCEAAPLQEVRFP